MKIEKVLLMVAGVIVALISILHILIIFLGPDAYRMSGAGEQMAVMTENGSIFPAVITFLIAAIFALWSWYAFSAAGFGIRLPWLRVCLYLIASIFLLRGIAGVPMWFYYEGLAQTPEPMVFLVGTSLFSFGIGLLYLIGGIRTFSKGN